MVERLRGLLAPRARPRLAAGGAATSAVEPLRVVQVGVGNAIHMVPIDDVLSTSRPPTSTCASSPRRAST